MLMKLTPDVWKIIENIAFTFFAKDFTLNKGFLEKVLQLTKFLNKSFTFLSDCRNIYSCSLQSVSEIRRGKFDYFWVIIISLANNQNIEVLSEFSRYKIKKDY